MAFTYNITKNSGDSHQADPYWLAVVIPFKNKITFNPHFSNPANASLPKINPVEEDKKPILIDDDCISWSTSSSKENHISSLSLTLLPTATNYVSSITPEDWIIFWAFNNHSDYVRVKNLVSNLKRANQFKNAPKFIGRINSVFKEKGVRDNGRIDIHYVVSAAGFSELDTNMYFDQALQEASPEAQVYWSDFSKAEKELANNSILPGQKIIEALFEFCLGIGPTSLSNTDSISVTPNEAYLIPSSVVKLLLGSGAPRFKSVGYTYADLVKMYIGIQNYKATDRFLPIIKNKIHRIYETGSTLRGVFTVPPLNFNNQAVWSILQTYLCAPVNEMYTCLKVDNEDGEGYVLPTLVCRQIPFSTPTFYNDTKIRSTNFLNLPRWNIDDSMIVSLRVGKSNTLRYNYMHIVPFDIEGSNQVNQISARVLAQPIADAADIKRAGLRPIITTLGVMLEGEETTNDERNMIWNRVMADILFGSHLKYTGTVNLKGIQEPICEGDNCVIDNVIYQIERVVHTGHIDSFTGRKEFSTTLQLSNGISVASDKYNKLIYPEESPESNFGINFDKEA